LQDTGAGDDERDADGSLQRREFLPLAVVAEHFAVVACKDDEGIVEFASLCKLGEHLAEAVV